MQPVPIDKVMSAFQGLVTDIEPENLAPQFLYYTRNTQWVNPTTIGKRNGFTKKTWLGTGYLKPGNPSGLTRPKVLEYKAFKKRGGTQIYEIVALQELQPASAGAATGYLYIEITNASTGALVSSTLQAYNGGGVSRNQNPTLGKMVQYKDYVFLADGSTDKIFYLDLTTPGNTTWTTLTLNTALNPIFEANEVYNDVDIHTDKLFVTGSFGKVYYSATLNPIDFLAANGAGFISYRDSSGLIATQIVTSYLGLMISSENKDLNEYGMDLMTGTVPYDITLPATESRGYQVTNLSNDTSFISGSSQNIDNNIISLTQSGVMDLATLIATSSGTTRRAGDRSIELKDTLSHPIDNLVRRFNTAADNIYSCYDPTKKRYYFSIPDTGDTASSTVYVYDYKFGTESGVPRWSVWRLNLLGILGLFTAKNLPFVADTQGELYQLEQGTTDDGKAILGAIESAAIGGDTFPFEKQWEFIAATLKVPQDTADKYFNAYAVSDEYLGVTNAYDDVTREVILNNKEKYPSTFSRLYPFSRNRTFNDGGLGAEVFFMVDDLPNSRTLRLVIEEKLDPDGNTVDTWELKNIYIKGMITNIANQNEN